MNNGSNKPVLDLAHYRKSYHHEDEDFEQIAHRHWWQSFALWFAAAEQSGQLEPNAFVLGTVDSAGQVSTRTVLAKQVSEEGIVFFTGLNSRKGQALQEHPQASASFVWLSITRQIHLRGLTSVLPPERVEHYWQQRPRGSQLGAWASHQSAPISSRAALDEQYQQVVERFHNVDIPVPPSWGGFVLNPHTVEFWSGANDRLHNRIVLTKKESTWVAQRLQP